MAALRFQSEYDRNYDYRGGRRVRDTFDQQRFAGKESIKMHPAIEPPIQRKKRVDIPCGDDHVQLNTLGEPADDDFMLIGRQDEMFAPSIPYKNYAKGAGRSRHPPRPSTAPPGGRNRQSRNRREMGAMHDYRQRSGDDFEIATPDTPRIEKQQVRPFSAHPRRRTRSPVRNGTYWKPSEKHNRHERRNLISSQTQTKEKSLEDALRMAAGVRVPGETYFQSKERPLTHQSREIRDHSKEKPMWRYSYHDSRSQSPPKHKANDRPLDQLREKARDQYNGRYELGDDGYEQNHRSRYDYNDHKTRQNAEWQNNDQHDRQERHHNGVHERYPKDYRDPREDDYYDEYRHRQVSNDYNSRNYSKPLIRANDHELDREISKLKSKLKSRGRDVIDEDYRDEDPSMNYSKKHKLGLAEAKRPVPLQRLSEYRRQYEWKKGFHDSPLINAQDVVHRSHLDPPRNVRSLGKSEYSRQFAPLPENRTRHHSVSPKPRERTSKPFIRSKSAGPRRSRSPPPRVEIEGRQYAANETLNPQRMSFPLGPQRRVLSEYTDQFRTVKPIESVWYDQIAELRKKVHEYRQRGRGTHFSREHLVQLMSNSNEHWDPPSSSPRYHDLERPAAGLTSQVPRPRFPSPQGVNQADEEGRVTTPQIEKGTRHHFDKTTPAVGGAILTAPKPTRDCTPGKRAKQEFSDYSVESSIDSLTPRQLRLDLAAAGKPSLDTHEIIDEEASHDTPIRKSDVILQNGRPKNPTFKQKKRSGPVAGVAVKNRERKGGATISPSRGKKPQETYTMSNGAAPHVIKGTKDYHQISDNVDAYRGGRVIDDDDDSAPRTPLGHYRGDGPNNQLSSSVQSLASSASLASQTLERARKRRDQFWRDG